MVIKFSRPCFPRSGSTNEFENLLRRSYKLLHPSQPRLLPKGGGKPHVKNPAA